MFKARLRRLEAAEYALLCAHIDAPTDGTPTNPAGPLSPGRQSGDLSLPDSNNDIDARAIAIAFTRSAKQLELLHRAETHLRRSYNRTWDRLERMQKERHKLPLDEALKRSQVWLTYESQRTNHPENTPAPHPDLNEKGQFPTYPPGHPMHRGKEWLEKEEAWQEKEDAMEETRREKQDHWLENNPNPEGPTHDPA